jgi:adenylate cyclase
MDESQTPVTEEAAALHGDVVGYSRLTADNEIETFNTLQVLRRTIEHVTDSHGGTVASFVGDAFLAVFPEEASAVSAALEIQARLAQENAGLPEGRRMLFRLGIHSGRVSHLDDRWWGDAINIVARLQALAEPAGVNISREALAAAGELPVRIESLGPTRLKNIPEPVTIFRLVPDTSERDGSKPWRRRIAKPTRPSLAVSPFVNYGEAEDGYFADGLMMALVISLMQIPGVDVVGESSSLDYRGEAFSATQLGHELGVRYVLEGAVQRSGPQVRVLTQLIDVERNSTVWADRFEAAFDDVFAAQDDIVTAIATALDVEVLGGEVARMYRASLGPAAVEVVYQGLQHLSRFSPSDMQLAADAFERVIELEPDAPTGYSMAALANNWIAMFGGTDDAAGRYDLAEERAKQSLLHGDGSGIAQTVLAHVRVQKHEWDGAREAVRQATELRPSCDLAYGIAASVMRYLGDWEDAVRYADRAARLSPLFATWYQSVRANAEFIGGNYEVAADVAEGVIAEDEDDLEALLTLAASQSALGRSRHAVAAITHARHTRPGLTAADLEDLPYRERNDLERFLLQLRAAGLA